MSAASLRTRLQDLYFGEHETARRFRYGLVAFDVLTILVFIVSSFAGEARWMIVLDLVLAAVLSLELAARLYAEPARMKMLLSFTTLTDIVVILSLLLAAFVENLAFLRIVRALRLLRSYHLLRDLRTGSPWFRLHEDIIQRTVNLGVFIFIVTSVVYVTHRESQDNGLRRRALFHHHHAYHHRLWRHHASGPGRPPACGRHYVRRCRAVPAVAPGDLPSQQGALRMP
jgi:voltage-gated potassium channel